MEGYVARKNIKRDKDLIVVSSAGGGGRTQSAASERAAGRDLYPPLFPLRGWRHRSDKVVDDWEAVGGDAAVGLRCGQTSPGLLVHLGEKLTKSHCDTDVL